MANLILPGDSDLAIGLREPNLLVPGCKPSDRVKLDRANFFGSNVEDFWLFGGNASIAKNLGDDPGADIELDIPNTGLLAYPSYIDTVFDPTGIASRQGRFWGATGYCTVNAPTTGYTSTVRKSLGAEYTVIGVSTSSNGFLLGLNGGGYGNGGYIFYPSGGVLYHCASSSTVSLSASAPVLGYGRLVLWALTRKGSQVTGWINGIKYGPATLSSAAVYSYYQLGLMPTGTIFRSLISWQATFKCGFSEDQMNALLRDPFQILEPAT